MLRALVRRFHRAYRRAYRAEQERSKWPWKTWLLTGSAAVTTVGYIPACCESAGCAAYVDTEAAVIVDGAASADAGALDASYDGGDAK